MTDSFGLPYGPNKDFIFGADKAGRDVFVRAVYGARTSLIVAHRRHRASPSSSGRSSASSPASSAASSTRGSRGSSTSSCRFRSCCSRSGSSRRAVLPPKGAWADWCKPGPAARHLRDRALHVAVHRAHRAREHALAPREGVHRGVALARRRQHADHVPGGAPEPRRADHRLHDAAHPGQHPLRGRALVPRPRRSAADALLGPACSPTRLRIYRVRVVAHALPRHLPGADHPGLQSSRRRSSRRPRPEEQPMPEQSDNALRH